jgi:hypothetical protein
MRPPFRARICVVRPESRARNSSASNSRTETTGHQKSFPDFGSWRSRTSSMRMSTRSNFEIAAAMTDWASSAWQRSERLEPPDRQTRRRLAPDFAESRAMIATSALSPARIRAMSWPIPQSETLVLLRKRSRTQRRRDSTQRVRRSPRELLRAHRPQPRRLHGDNAGASIDGPSVAFARANGIERASRFGIRSVPSLIPTILERRQAISPVKHQRTRRSANCHAMVDRYAEFHRANQTIDCDRL